MIEAYNRMSFVTKIIGLIIIVVLLNAVMMVWLAGSYVNSQNRVMIYEQLEVESALVTETIDHFVEVHETIVYEMANNRIFTEFVNRVPDGADVSIWDGYDEIVSDLEKTVATLNSVNLLYLALEEQNQFVSHIDDTGPEDIVISEREWYRRTIQSEDVVVSKPYIDALTGELAITVSKALYNESGTPSGAVGMDLLLEELIDTFSEFGVRETGRISVFDESGAVIYDALHGVSDDALQQLKIAEDGMRTPFSDGSYYYFLNDTSSSGWSILSSIEISEVSEMGSGFLINVILIFVSIGLFTAGIAYMSTRHLVSPVEELEETIRDRKETELGLNIPISLLSRNDEIGSLALTLSEMSISIDEYVDELQIKNKKLEYEIENHKHTQSELHLMLAVLAETNQAFFIVDRDLELVYQNQASDELVSNYSEVNGWSPKSVLSILGVEKYRHIMMNMVKPIEWEANILDRDLNVSVRAITHKLSKYYLGIIEDISDRNKVMDLLDTLQTYDELTGVMHKERAVEEFSMCIKSKQNAHAYVIACDIDGLSTIYNAKGEDFINKLLLMLSQRLQEVTSDEDIIGRSNTEFLLYKLFESTVAIDDQFGELVSYLNKKYLVQGESVYLPLRFGIASFPEHETSIKKLTEYSITALNHNKLKGGQKKYSFFQDSMKDRSEEEYSLYTKLTFAIEREEIALAFQPQVDARTGSITGLEALLRWTHFGESIRPDQFIPIAEKYNLMIDIGDWVIEEAIRTNRKLIDSGVSVPISINVSGIQFDDPLLVDKLEKLLHRYQVPPELIKIEITENTLINHKEVCVEKLHVLNNLGVKVSIDDFGTGYSSLAYLKQFKVDELKIDRSFIMGIPETDNGAITELIITLAEKLNLSVVAEGAETKEQVDFLVERGACKIQGYYYYKPMTFEELTSIMRKEMFG